MRLDAALVERGIVPSRERAKEYIKAGKVQVNGKPAGKPAMSVTDEDKLELVGETLRYVSRGGLKLEKALQTFPIELSGKPCLDIGASTGGFTDCMLQNGAAHVVSVDVGTDQLAEKLRLDPRVTVMEQTNVRYLTKEILGEKARFAPPHLMFLRPAAAAFLAWEKREEAVEYKNLSPLYLRPPQAERQKNLRERV